LDNTRRDLTPILAELPRERSMLLPALQRVQEELGYLPLWAQEVVGEHVRVPKSEVYGVATHYPELRPEAAGRHVVRVCGGLSCRVVGAPAILSALEACLGIPAGHAATDGGVSLEETHCAFVCGVGPVVEIDGVAHAGLSADEAAALVRAVLARDGRS
jgi:NADH:ubiquinone oxidoreductase subunit E